MELVVIQKKIYEIRGHRVMLDFDLAELYAVETRVLNQAVKRNIERFPERFMFRLTEKEWESMRSRIVTASESNSSQFVMSSRKHRGSQYLPFAFTEHGVTMLASVLRSKKAIKMNIAIVEAFITLKEFALNYKELSDKLKEIENTYNRQFKDVYEALDLLLQENVAKEDFSKRRRIGYKIPKRKS